MKDWNRFWPDLTVPHALSTLKQTSDTFCFLVLRENGHIDFQTAFMCVSEMLSLCVCYIICSHETRESVGPFVISFSDSTEREMTLLLYLVLP